MNIRRSKTNLQIFAGLLATALALSVFAGAASAQGAGSISGRVLDASTGDPMFGVSVIAPLPGGGQAFAQTDFDGRYTLNVPPGAYRVTFQMAGMDPRTENVNVGPGETESLSVTLGIQVAEEVVVEGRALNNTEASLLALQRKSGTVSDGISAEAISRSPDSSAGDVLKRVTGVTIVGGRFVFVRGLGERYSYTMLNGAQLSSPEPDQRVVPLDLFPAGLIKNIRIIKTFAPEYPGEFSGGIVQIETKEFPDELTVVLGAGVGGNNETTDRKFLTYKGSGGDPWGKDSGFRERPGIVDAFPAAVPFVRGDIFGGIPSQLVQLGGGLFPDTWDTQQIRAPFDRSFKLSIGNSHDTDYGRFGLLYGTSYSRQWRRLEKTENVYQPFNPISEFFPDYTILGILNVADSDEYTENVLWGHNFNLSWEPVPNQRLSSKTFYSRDSEKEVKIKEGLRIDPGGGDGENNYRSQNTSWIEREIIHQVLSGTHAVSLFENSRPHKLEWDMSVSQALRNQPNLTQQTWERPANQPILRQRLVGADNNFRFYSEAEDETTGFSASYELPFEQWSGLQSKFKFGGSATRRFKDFRSDLYTYQFVGTGDQAQAQNEFVPGSITFSAPLLLQEVYRFEESSTGNDSYDANQKVHAWYGQVDMPIVPKVRVVGGVRYEDSYQYVETYNSTQPLFLEFDFLRRRNQVGELRSKDTLPSLNVTYEFHPDMNFRAAYTETVNRPDFRDLSPFGFRTEFGGERIFGNNNLDRAYIHNYDLRWEWYLTPEEYVGVGAFLKDLSRPIETVGLSQLNLARDLTFVNAEEGEIRGIELDARKDLLEQLSVSANIFFIRSRVELFKWTDRYFFATGVRDPNNIAGLFRPTELEGPLTGQSPYVYNLKLTYWLTREREGSISLFYNIFGDRRVATGANGAPDIYEEAAGVLDLVYEQSYQENLSWKVAIKNITDTRFKRTQESPLIGRDLIVESYRQGISYSFSLDYTF